MADSLSITFAALADPTRRAILARLASGEATVNQLAEPFDISAGLISRTREAQARPCKLEPEALKRAHSWIEHYRRFWDESFDRMAVYLAELQAEEAAANPPNLKDPPA
jgi:DNA-binding transcriptional ArsR family regulator